MTVNRSSGQDTVWAQVERDKRVDRRLRRLTIAAWTMTIIVVLVFGVATAIRLATLYHLAPWGMIVGSAFPLLAVLGVLCALIATLGTVGIFLRLRTASLTEIHLRLAALEEMLASRGDGTTADRPGR